MENTESDNDKPQEAEVDMEQLEDIVKDSFNTIELLEEQMAQVANDFESIDGSDQVNETIDEENKEEE